VRNRAKSGTARSFVTPRRQNRPLPEALKALGRGGMKKTAATEAAGCRMDGAQDAKKGILLSWRPAAL